MCAQALKAAACVTTYLHKANPSILISCRFSVQFEKIVDIQQPVVQYVHWVDIQGKKIHR